MGVSPHGRRRTTVTTMIDECANSCAAGILTACSFYSHFTAAAASAASAAATHHSSVIPRWMTLHNDPFSMEAAELMALIPTAMGDALPPLLLIVWSTFLRIPTS